MTNTKTLFEYINHFCSRSQQHSRKQFLVILLASVDNLKINSLKFYNSCYVSMTAQGIKRHTDSSRKVLRGSVC